MKQKHSVSVVCYTIAGLAALITISLSIGR